MEDYNIDDLAETLALAKKMLRNRSRDEIIDNSYRGYDF
jgi:xylose isomerase